MRILRSLPLLLALGITSGCAIRARVQVRKVPPSATDADDYDRPHAPSPAYRDDEARRRPRR